MVVHTMEDREKPLSPRGLILVGIVALVAVSGSLQQFGRAQAAAAAGDPYQVTSQLERLRPALNRLPPSGVVGYFAAGTVSETVDQAMYFAAQYAVAPRLLVQNPVNGEPEWWIGNFTQPVDYASVGASRGLTLVEDVGQGIVLFRRSSK